MKAKILFALAALLMLGSVSLNAQEVGNSSNSESTTQLEGDLNHDNKVDVADVTYLVNLIMKNQSEAKDGTYYWYIGAENPSTISNIQTDNNVAGWHEIGSSLNEFNISFSNSTNLIEFDETTQYYVIIPNDLYLYAADGNTIMEGKTFNPVTCNITGYKAFQYKSAVWDVKGLIIKEGIPVTGVSVSTSESSINVGNTLQLEVAVEPSSATNKNVTWSSSNPEIATVDEATGLVTGIALGTATIIATSVDGGKTATTRVEVVETLSNYYWYIGVENPSSISNIQTDNTVAGWHEIGTSLNGFTLNATQSSNQVVLNTQNVKYYYYVVIPTSLHIYDSSNTTNVEDTYFESVTCNTTGYKALHYTVSPGTRVVKGIIIR